MTAEPSHADIADAVPIMQDSNVNVEDVSAEGVGTALVGSGI